MEKHNIKTKEFSNKKKENKKFLIKTASRAPTKDFNQPKQFTTTTSTTSTTPPTTKRSYLLTPKPTPSSVRLTGVPSLQNILGKPASYPDWDSSDDDVDDLVPLYQLDEHYQYDPFFDYKEYDEEETYYNFWGSYQIWLEFLYLRLDVTKFNITIINVTSITMFNILW